MYTLYVYQPLCVLRVMLCAACDVDGGRESAGRVRLSAA